ncbi:hypothetical protein PR048_015494 [Dryococelus australis]|uniref:Uncharacterized protein n=1 Tax=Dryococelus australis TaxID=614101 RepID=A0ABQ9HHM0_9NEOP|nr:hypothetical protein PR048_015494 [Dryococelus australis]
MSSPSKVQLLMCYKTTAIIRNDLKDVSIDPDNYTYIEDISNVEYNENYVPETLRLLLATLISGKTNKDRKLAAIGQATVQAGSPRVLVTPLQLGLAVQLHEYINSRSMVESVNHTELRSSYSEVQRFECSAVSERETQLLELSEISETPERFIQ